MAAGKLHFDLVSPERLLYSANADMVVVPGTDGDFGVLAGHAPVISTLRIGVVDVKGAEDGADLRIFVKGGFAEVTAKGLTILAEEAAPLGDLKPPSSIRASGTSRRTWPTRRTTAPASAPRTSSTSCGR